MKSMSSTEFTDKNLNKVHNHKRQTVKHSHRNKEVAPEE